MELFGPCRLPRSATLMVNEWTWEVLSRRLNREETKKQSTWTWWESYRTYGAIRLIGLRSSNRCCRDWDDKKVIDVYRERDICTEKPDREQQQQQQRATKWAVRKKASVKVAGRLFARVSRREDVLFYLTVTCEAVWLLCPVTAGIIVWFFLSWYPRCRAAVYYWFSIDFACVSGHPRTVCTMKWITPSSLTFFMLVLLVHRVLLLTYEELPVKDVTGSGAKKVGSNRPERVPISVIPTNRTKRATSSRSHQRGVGRFNLRVDPETLMSPVQRAILILIETFNKKKKL